MHKKIWLDDESCDYEELIWDATCCHTQYFKVYNQDLEKKCLVEIKSIGDHALVVDITTPYVCRLRRASRKIVYVTLMIMEREYLRK